MIYKLSAQTEAEMKAFLVHITEAKDEDGNPAEWQQYLSNRHKGIHNCVYLGKLIDTPAVYDEEDNLVSDAVYYAGFHADIMCEEELVIPSNISVHNPVNPKHSFAGFEVLT